LNLKVRPVVKSLVFIGKSVDCVPAGLLQHSNTMASHLQVTLFSCREGAEEGNCMENQMLHGAPALFVCFSLQFSAPSTTFFTAQGLEKRKKGAT